MAIISIKWYHFCSLHALLAFGRGVLKALTYICIRSDFKQSEVELAYIEKLEDVEQIFLIYGTELEYRL